MHRFLALFLSIGLIPVQQEVSAGPAGVALAGGGIVRE
jgi:hypothetical protein